MQAWGLNVDERLVAAIEEPLKQVVDAGYSRNDSGPAESESDDTEADTTEAEDTKADDAEAEEKAKRAEKTESDNAETDKTEPSDDSEKAA
ncbi:hypothetical protein BH10ACT9_BH10ACT9_20030 [soil metagenome]